MLVAGLLSLLVPGVGQLYRGATRRGLVLLGITLCIMVGGLLLASWVSLDALSGVDRSIVTAILVVDLALLAFRTFAVVDAARPAVPLLVGVLVALTAAPHVAAAWVTVRSYEVLDSVFADEEPCGTACDRGSVLLANVVRPLPAWVPKDAWEWALVERLGPGESAAARGRRARARGREAAVAEAVDDDPAARHRRGPGQLRRADGHDHPRGRAARHRPCGRVRDPAQPRAGAAREERAAVEGAAEPPLRAERRRRPGCGGAEAGGLEPARDPGRLLRARQPRRLRRSRRRARRRRDRRQGAAAGRGDAAGVGRAEAEDRRAAGRAAPLLRPRGARLRPLAQGLERLHADGPAALLPQRDGRPARPGQRDPQLRLAREDDRDERAHRHPAQPAALARAARELGRRRARR